MYLPGVGPNRKKVLSQELGIETFGDLLEYYPYKYVDRSKIYSIRDLTGDMPFIQVVGRILSFETFEMGPRKQRVVAHFTDGTGLMDLVWFNGGKYAKQNYKIGQEYLVFGRPTVFNNRIQVQHPEMESLESKAENTESAADPKPSTLSSPLKMRPYYNTTEKMKNSGLVSRQMERMVTTLVQRLREPLAETLPQAIIASRHLMGRDEALRTVHFPADARQLERARVRLKFEELFFVQLNILRYASFRSRRYSSYMFPRIGQVFNTFYKEHLPFELTGAQKRVMHEIRADLCTGRQMNRLLQGDVGSGKTLVALMAMLIAIDNGCQACIMAPTEILAEQHLQTIRAFLGNMDVSVELLTGNVKGRQRQNVLQGLQDGTVQLLVGTHAVIEDTVQFQRLGLAVIDEQHRFGVAQRAKLWGKNIRPPHVLVMTATPIPRTLAMTLYGDLDVSVIDQLPPGRKPIQTEHVFDEKRPQLNNFLRRQMAQGRQVYVVYPLIKESEKSDMKDLENGFEAMKNVFKEFTVCMVHGKMKPAEKEAQMQEFISGRANMLVSTTVIEVGVNVPNATVMVIENAERFGLSQLHQLRGRVGRGGDQSYCLLITKYQISSDTRKRIDIMTQTTNGFEIAEADLRLRGPGDLEGTLQSGLPFNLQVADLSRDGALLTMARDEAEQILTSDPMLSQPQNALLLNQLHSKTKNVVNWSFIS